MQFTEVDAVADGILLIAGKGDHHLVDGLARQHLVELGEMAPIGTTIEFPDMVVEEPYTLVSVVIVFIYRFIEEFRGGIGAHQQDIVVELALGEDGMDILAVDILGDGGEQKDQGDQQQVATKGQPEFRLQEIERGREQDGKDDGMVNDEDDLFREFIRTPFCIEPGRETRQVPDADAEQPQDQGDGQARIGLRREPQEKKNRYTDGQSIKGITKDMIKTFFPFHPVRARGVKIRYCCMITNDLRGAIC